MEVTSKSSPQCFKVWTVGQIMGKIVPAVLGKKEYI